MADRNKFISYYLNKRKTFADFEVVIFYSSVNSFDFHHTQRLLFLIAHDDLKRFNCFYQDFIDDLDKKAPENTLLIFSLYPYAKNELTKKKKTKP